MPGAWQHHRMTSRRPGSRRTLLPAAVAVLAAVLAVVLPSAAGASAAQTRVWASHPGMIFTVGTSRPVLAVQGRGGAASRPLFVSGLCVAAEDTGSDLADAATCGGASFTAATKVLLASGLAVPIASLKPGEKVLATNTKTGKTQAEPVAAVLLHHDTNRYDLTVKTAHGSAVIRTTSSHVFWKPTTRQWVRAAALGHGSSLRTPAGPTAIVLSGRAPANTNGWMWDLSVPGNGDHDFYIDVANTAVLVHNCEPGEINGYTRHGLNQAISRDGVGVSPSAINDAVTNPTRVIEQANGTFRYVGQNATVVLNENGEVVTTWARNSLGWGIVR
jgi:Pretoxin HINT domain